MEGDFSLHEKYWKNFKLNSKLIAFNVLYVPFKPEKISHVLKLQCNKEPENQVFLLMITDGNKWHYLAVKNSPLLLRGVTSKHVGDFYFLNCFTHKVQEKT